MADATTEAENKITRIEKLNNKLNKLAERNKAISDKFNKVTSTINAPIKEIGEFASSITGTLAPAIEFNNALASIANLGVDKDEVANLGIAARSFSKEYGISAAGFVASSQDIAGAMGSLKDGQLLKITTSSNLMAKALGEDSSSMSKYMTTMYGAFKNNADKMGKVEWAEQVAIKTEAMFEKIQVSASAMENSFGILGSSATNAGLSMVDQMAVLGGMTANFDSGAVGDNFKAFVMSVPNAGSQLGFKLTNEDGEMNSMSKIIEDITTQFGPTLDTGELKTIKAALEDDKAVAFVEMLMQSQGGIKDAIQAATSATDNTKLIERAQKNVTPMQKMNAAANDFKITIGQALLPAINAVLPTLTSLANTFGEWATENPGLVKTIGLIALGIAGLSTAMAVLGPVITIAKGALTAWTTASKLAKMGAGAFTGALNKLSIGSKISAIGVKLFSGAMKLAGLAARMNPFGIIMTALMLLVPFFPKLKKYWDMLTQAFSDIAWSELLKQALGYIINPFSYISDLFTSILGLWDYFKESFGDTSWGQAIITALDPLMNALGGFRDFVSGIAELADSALGKVASFFGFGGSDEEENPNQKIAKAATQLPAATAEAQIQSAPKVKSLQGAKTANTSPGGIKHEMHIANSQNCTQTQNNGNVTHNHYHPHSSNSETWALGAA